MSYKTAFPDFDNVPIGFIWHGASTWVDVSWNQDTCPAFHSLDIIPGYIIRVSTDYKNHKMREDINLKQFVISLYDDGEDFLATLYESNNREDTESILIRLERVNFELIAHDTEFEAFCRKIKKQYTRLTRD